MYLGNHSTVLRRLLPCSTPAASSQTTESPIPSIQCSKTCADYKHHTNSSIFRTFTESIAIGQTTTRSRTHPQPTSKPPQAGLDLAVGHGHGLPIGAIAHGARDGMIDVIY